MHDLKKKIKPRSFREQFVECKERGTVYQVTIRAPRLSGTEDILMCDKYKKQCSSHVCLRERKHRTLQLSGWFNNSGE